MVLLLKREGFSMSAISMTLDELQEGIDVPQCNPKSPLYETLVKGNRGAAGRTGGDECWISRTESAGLLIESSRV